MQQRSEETRIRILTAAETMFAQKGFDASGVTDICTAAGVSKGAFYHHFPSKHAIFQALLEQWLAQLDSLLSANLHPAQNVPATLLAMTDQTGRIFEGARSRASIFFEFWMQASRQPDIWQSVVEPYRRYLEQFAELFRNGISEGSISPEMDPRNGSRLLIALVLGMLLQAFFDPDGAPWGEVTRESIQTSILGMRKKAQ